jgi:hypothetical protein
MAGKNESETLVFPHAEGTSLTNNALTNNALTNNGLTNNGREVLSKRYPAPHE